MSLGALLLELHRLLEQPLAPWEKIVALLEQNTALAEYEVLRFYAASKARQNVEKQLNDPDPRVRKAALGIVRTLLPRGKAATFLRKLVKDPDSKVRSHARRIVRKLRLADVALPDSRFRLTRNQRITSTTPGAWNPSGWSFGVYGRHIRAPARIEMLAKLGLPVLETKDQVARFVGVSREELPRLMRPGTGVGSPYVSFTIAKASGGVRAIAAPRTPLRNAQRKILRELLDKLAAHDAAHGFVRGRSTVTNAQPHAGARMIIKVDLQDFFPTVHYRRVAGFFRRLGYPQSAAATLASLCTYRPILPDGLVCWPGVLPQGAPTSPAIANFVCRKLDGRLRGLAEKAGATYTRYADDLTFSFREDVERKNVGRFLWWIDQICQQEGFSENARKRRVLRPRNAQRVTGIIVNSGMSVPRRERRRLRAILANVRKNGLEAEARGEPQFGAYLIGLAAYVKMVQPELGTKLLREARELVKAHKKQP